MCCLAKEGHTVYGFDISETKVAMINEGAPPISEPGVGELLCVGLNNGRIQAFTEVKNRLDECETAIVCVGTPSAPDGSHNMTYIAEVTRQIATAIRTDRKKPLTVVYRSTIRPGTVSDLIAPIFLSEIGPDYISQVEIVYNPEFLRESTAINDYFNPPKIVIGTQDASPSANVAEIYKNINAPTFIVNWAESEITKFVDNTWHAVKVAYANEIGRLCINLGLSAKQVHQIFISDTKLNISSYYLQPGGAFGGSCLPKDVRAMQHIAADSGANTHLIDSLLRSNDAHKFALFQYATKDLEPGAKILLVGLAFKASTDDLRESPNIDLARNILREGYQLTIYDPAINANKLMGANLGYAYSQFPHLSKLLVNKETAEQSSFDRILIANDTDKDLNLPSDVDCLNLKYIP